MMHSLPYVVAATLIDGTVTLHSFNNSTAEALNLVLTRQVIGKAVLV